MRIVGFNFDKVSVERNKEFSKEIAKNMKINTNVEIKDVVKQDIDLFNSPRAFNFKYTFKVSYGPDYVDLLFEGGILILFNDDEIVKKLTKSWKDKYVLDEIRIPLLNSIYSKCNLKAFQLEEDFNLPYHLPMPKIVDISKEDPNKDINNSKKDNSASYIK